MTTKTSKVPPTFASTGDPGDEQPDTETPDTDQESTTEAHIQVGLSPLGGIGVNVQDKNGEKAGITLTIEEAEQLGARLIGLTGMLVHVSYMEMAREQMEAQKIAQKIHLPR